MFKSPALILISVAFVVGPRSAHASLSVDDMVSACQRVLTAVGLRKPSITNARLLAAADDGSAVLVTKAVGYGNVSALNYRLKDIRWGLKYTPDVIAKLFPFASQVYVFDGTVFSVLEGEDGSPSVQPIQNDFARYAFNILGFDENLINIAWLNYNMKPVFPAYVSIFRSHLSGPQVWWSLEPQAIAGRVQIYSAQSENYYYLNVEMNQTHTWFKLTRRPCDHDTSYLKSDPSLVQWSNHRWAASSKYLQNLAPADVSDPLNRLLSSEGQAVVVDSGQPTIDFIKRLAALGFDFDRKLRR